MSLVQSTRLNVLHGLVLRSLVLRTLSIRFYSLNVHTLLQKVLMAHFCIHKYNNDGARYARATRERLGHAVKAARSAGSDHFRTEITSDHFVR